MKDLYITASDGYNWDQLKFMVNSLNQSGFDGDKVIIVMNCPDLTTVDKLVENGFRVITVGKKEDGKYVHKSPFKPHVERFFHIWNFLRQVPQDYSIRSVITTDARDVIFQTNPSDFLRENLDYRYKDMICASEGLQYQYEPWGNGNLHDTFGGFFHNIYKDKTIYNVGVLAGRYDTIKDLCLMIYQIALNRLIPITDQAAFNFLLWQFPYTQHVELSPTEDGFALHAGTFADPTKIELFRPHLLEDEPKFEDGDVLTYDGSLYCIVHQYDRVPAWKEHFERVYG